MVYHHQRQQNRWCMLTWRAHNTLPPTTPRDHDFPTPYRHHQRWSRLKSCRLHGQNDLHLPPLPPHVAQSTECPST